MFNKAVFALLLVVSLLCAIGNLAPAKEVRATLGGRVVDVAGEVGPDVSVVVVSDATGVKQQTQTNADGNWVVQFLLPARYQFSVTASGFKTASRTGITLQVGDYKQIDVQLQIGDVSQSVEVSAEVPLIDTSSSTSGTVISSSYMTEMPTISHVPTLLATLSPGVVAQDQNNNIVRPWSYIGASQVTADGGRNNIYSNNFQLDCMPNTNAVG